MLEEMCKRQYTAVVTAAEEKAVKKLKEADEEIVEVRTSNSELEAMLASYRTQAMAMAERLTALKETNVALNDALHDATHRRSGDGAAEEEAQSSSLEADQVVVKIVAGNIDTIIPATIVSMSTDTTQGRKDNNSGLDRAELRIDHKTSDHRMAVAWNTVFCIAKVSWAGLRWWVAMLLIYAVDAASDPLELVLFY
nr:pollen-specific leucine-rich repeat extensin-like protein 1 [Ipomoea batatas]